MPLFRLVLIAAALLWAGVVSGCHRSHSHEYLTAPNALSADAIDINSAGIDELRGLPGVGEKLALQIIEFRQKNGPFRRSEELMLVHGISDMRFRKMRSLIKIQ